MAKISTYPIVSTPTFNDLLIGTDVENLNETKNFSIGDISSLIIEGSYVPYIGAIQDVDLGLFSITASSFILPGGLSSQFLKADGTLDSTIYQVEGNYITGLTGEASASGPGVANVTISNGAVIGKVLTGLTITGGSISSTDNILQAFGKLQNQVNSLYGGAIYQGTWNASTNTPALSSGVGVQGWYYIVNVAGNTVLDGISDWNVGDWVIFDGTAWQQVDNTDTVVSVNGKVGVVVLTTTDINEGTNLYYTDGRARASISLTTTGNSGASTYDNITGIFNIPTYTLSGLGGVPSSRQLTINGTQYDLSADRSWSVGTVTSVGTSGPITGGTITGSGTIGITQSGIASDGYLSSVDWNTFNNKQNALTNPVTGTGTVYYLPMWTGISSLGDSTISQGLNVVNFNFDTPTGSTINYINTNGVDYTYTIQMNNSGTRQTYHSYTDGNILQQINGSIVSKNLQSGQLVLPNYTGISSFPGTATGYLGFDSSGNIITIQNLATVSSVGLSMPSAFTVSNSPITSSGVIAVTGAGTSAQYVRGDGQLATFPSTAGGGSSVNYYLNGSVASSVAGYQQMDNNAIIGGGTDFTLVGNGLIAQFLTDVGNPNRLQIPGGAWNFEMYFQVSSAGGNQKFYVELLKYDGVTFTSIASSSAIPEEITGGTSIDLYLTSLAVPTTALLVTDRLAIRVYIVDNAAGRTVTLHTEDNTLCEIITTFAGGIAALNGLTANTQYLATGTSGTDFNISSVIDTHTFNLPTASATNRGALSSANWSTFNSKVGGSGVAGQVAYWDGTNSQTGSNNLFWDAANARLGIGTNAPVSDLNIFKNTSGSSTAIVLSESWTAGNFSGLVLNYYNTGYTTNQWQSAKIAALISAVQSNGLALVTNNGGNIAFWSGATATEKMRLIGLTGNLVLQNGGTFTDGGQRLQVYGDAFIKGSGATSATNALLVQNSAGTEILRVYNDGGISQGVLNSTFTIGGPLRFLSSNPTILGQSILSLQTPPAGSTHIVKSTATGNTSGAISVLNVGTAAGGFAAFSPTSGTATYTVTNILAEINQTGGANGITRGLSITPSLTAASDWRSIEWSNNTGWGLYGAGTANNYLGGSLGIGTTNLTNRALSIQSTMSGTVNGNSIIQSTIISSSVTSTAVNNYSQFTTQAASFNIGSVYHYFHTDISIGAGSSVTDQYGYFVSNITAATNNYGFYGAISNATNRWNIYMSGTANNYMAGALGIGSTSIGGNSFAVAKSINTNGSSSVISNFQVNSGVTTIYGFRSRMFSGAGTYTVSDAYHFSADIATPDVSSVFTNQYGFIAQSSMTGATNNYGFRGDIPSGTNRWNIFMAGTADNYLAGKLLIGTTTVGTFALDVVGETRLKGSGNTNATAALNVQNSDGRVIVRAFNNGAIQIGNLTSNSIYPFSSSIGTPDIQGTSIAFSTSLLTSGNSIAFRNAQVTNRDYTSGDGTFVRLYEGYAPTSGTGTWQSLVLTPTINQTGGANGITRGLYIQPTLTSAADWRSIEWSNNSGWGLYGAGTANNYMAGATGVGTSTMTYKFNVSDTTTYVAGFRGPASSYIVVGDTSLAGESGVNFRNSSGQGFIGIGGTFLGIAATSGANTITLSTGGFERLRVTSAGRLLLGTTTESTFLLDVNGTARVSGATTINGNTTINYDTQYASISGDANLFIKSGTTAANGVIGLTGNGFILQAKDGASNAYNILLQPYGGNVLVGTSTSIASAKLVVTSTTQGFLPPRMTNAERIAIVTPAVGLMVYCTDSVEGYYVYTSIGWKSLTMV